MPGQPTNGEVTNLLAEDKIITANLSWGPDGRRYKLEASVLAMESNLLLRLYGNVGIKNRSFGLLHNNVSIRRYCSSPNHVNPGKIPIRSHHKHTYDELDGDIVAYIPDDIKVGEANGELFDFLAECNIRLEGNYQALQSTT